MKLRHLWWGRRDKTPLDISAAVSSVALDMKLSRRRESLLLWSLCALLVFLVLWASLAPIDKIVRAEGRIIPAGRAQVVQHLEGGIVQDTKPSSK
jgi:adhesin transport system membrane fusion protein